MKASVRFPPEVRIVRSAQGDLYLAEDERRVRLGPAAPATLGMVKALRGKGLFEAELDETFGRLLEHGWLARTVPGADGPAVWIRTYAGFGSSGVDFARPVALSRFTVLRRYADDRQPGGGLVMESGCAASEARIVDPEPAELISSLANPRIVGGELPELLAGAGFLVNVPGPEDEDFRTRQWGVHELFFHGRSRWGARNGSAPVGPSSWAKGSFDPVPARRRDGPPAARPVVRLAVPAGAGTRDLIERRKSVRLYDEADPMRLGQLAAFLHRVARVRGTFEYEGVEYTDRPYPSGGGGHEIELYVAARNVAGLAPGLYRYDAFDHDLETVCDQGEGFTAAAARATTLPVPPQAVVILAARFGRLLGRYRGMGYATVLKNVGVLYQTMYLVATDLGLAPCALGNGDVDLFAAATGLDPLTESSVGEFALGSLPPAAEKTRGR